MTQTYRMVGLLVLWTEQPHCARSTLPPPSSRRRLLATAPHGPAPHSRTARHTAPLPPSCPPSTVPVYRPPAALPHFCPCHQACAIFDKICLYFYIKLISCSCWLCII